MKTEENKKPDHTRRNRFIYLGLILILVIINVILFSNNIRERKKENQKQPIEIKNGEEVGLGKIERIRSNLLKEMGQDAELDSLMKKWLREIDSLQAK